MRLRVEPLLRGLALVALAAWIGNALRPREGATDVVSGASVADALPRWTTSAATDSVHVRLDTVPDAASRAWLAALRGAGVWVTWSGDIRGAALETYPAVDPAGGVIVLAAAAPTPTGGARSPGDRTQSAVLSDALGPIDTMEVGQHRYIGQNPTAVSSFGPSRTGNASVGQSPILVNVGQVQGGLTLTSGAQPARAAVATASAPLRRIYVAGAAGWEAKFIIAALEESGWQVDASLFVGPGHTVSQVAAPGPPAGFAPDTSRHAAVILTDSTRAISGSRLERFVRQGGGLILLADANRLAAVQPLIAWRAGRRAVAPLGALPSDTAWRGNTRVPLEGIDDSVAVVLERRNGDAIIAARRHHAGRVMAVGYDETWRWRMAGGPTSVADHRAWWSRLAGSVALRPKARDDVVTSAAPLATLHAALGPPGGARASLASALPAHLVSNVLGAMLLASLLAEWLLRRARGAR